MKNKENDLVLQRKAGGSLIERCPVFSSDAQTLYVVWGCVIRAYSIKTGELVTDYEGLTGRAVGVQLHPTNPNAIVACSEKGELIQWDCKSRLSQKIVHLKYDNKPDTAVTGFYLLSSKSQGSDTNKCNVCIVWKRRNSIVSQLSICCNQTGKLLFDVKFRLDDHSHSLAVGGRFGEEFVAGIYKNTVQFADAVHWKQCDKQNIGGGRKFTCVACHPEEACIATGDNTGRVLIWWNLLSSGKPTYTVYHWHTLPAQAVAFSQAGSHFYSGGGECVLVKWTLDSPSNKNFLPRLASPIFHLLVAPENKFLAICTTDNGIRIVDPQLKLVSVIQHITWSIEDKHDIDIFPAGIIVDPHTKALVLNGRTGHIQFYSPHTKSLLYNLDITGMNYLTQERNEVIVNTDVTKVAINGDGKWMATVEQRDDGETNVELRLKFWHFDDVKQSFCLNTSVELPHYGAVVAVAFQPTSDPQQQLLVTAGSDFRFRMWSLVESDNIYKKGMMVWRCESMGFYRSLPIGDVSFSVDGSLLAVTFGPMLTVWVPETHQLKCSLTEAQAKVKLSHVEFGMVDCCHLVVTGSTEKVSVWNLLTLSLLWTVPVHVSILVADPYSDFMAVFTPDSDLFVFSPRQPQPTYIKKQVIPVGSSILCAAFVPHSGQERKPYISWQKHSLLYFLDSNQELLTLERPCEDVSEKGVLILPTASLQTITPFSSLFAKHAVSDVKKLHADTEQQLGVPGATAIRELLSAPAHTMPPISLLCGPLLHSLVAANLKKTSQELSSKEDDVEEVNKMETEESDVDSDDEPSVVKPMKSNQSEFKKPEISDSSRTMNLADLESNLASVLKENMDWTTLLST